MRFNDATPVDHSKVAVKTIGILQWYDCGADGRSGVQSRDVVLRFERFERESSPVTMRQQLFLLIFTSHLKCKYYPFGLINDMQMSISTWSFENRVA